jgi:hypothetical protein
MRGKRLRERGGRRDRVPRAQRRAAVDGAERRCVVAVDEDPLADVVTPLDLEADWLEVLGRVVQPDSKCLAVRFAQRLRRLLSSSKPSTTAGRCRGARQRADVDDVLEELPLPRTVYVAADSISGIGRR